MTVPKVNSSAVDSCEELRAEGVASIRWGGATEEGWVVGELGTRGADANIGGAEREEPGIGGEELDTGGGEADT